LWLGTLLHLKGDRFGVERLWEGILVPLKDFRILADHSLDLSNLIGRQTGVDLNCLQVERGRIHGRVRVVDKPFPQFAFAQMANQRRKLRKG
jgi:hypothetical protein